MANLADLKTQAEIDKLNAEIDQIRALREFEATRLGRFQPWSAAALAVVGIFSGAWATYEVASGYFEQQARQLEFTVTGDIINLSSQLADTDPIKRANAALLLSGFEEHAVPILVSTLRRTDRTGLADHIIHALALILKKERIKDHKDKVFAPLGRQMRLDFEEAARSSPSKTDSVIHYLDAVAQLGVGTGSSALLESIDDSKKILLSPTSKIFPPAQTRLSNRLDAVRREVERRTSAVRRRGKGLVTNRKEP